MIMGHMYGKHELVLPKIYCHILPLPPHNGHLSTTGTFFCSHCMVAPVERFNCMQNVEVVIEAEGRGG